MSSTSSPFGIRSLIVATLLPGARRRDGLGVCVIHSPPNPRSCTAHLGISRIQRKRVYQNPERCVDGQYGNREVEICADRREGGKGGKEDRKAAVVNQCDSQLTTGPGRCCWHQPARDQSTGVPWPPVRSSVPIMGQYQIHQKVLESNVQRGRSAKACQGSQWPHH